MANVWIRSTDLKDLVRADSVGQISIWNEGSDACVGLVVESGKNTIKVATKNIDFGAENTDEEIVLIEADIVRNELIELIHRTEANPQLNHVTVARSDEEWSALS